MSFIEGFKGGIELLKSSFVTLSRRPILLVPIFFSWLVFAGVILYLKYYFEFKNSILAYILYFYLFIFLITFVICLANLLMLEIIQQIESGEEVSFFKALKELFVFDTIKVIPIAAVWAIVWFLIVLLRALTKNKAAKGGEPSAKDAARTLGGAEGGSGSWTSLGLNAFEKLCRMSVFLSLPAIACEGKGPLSSFKHATEIIKKHHVEFFTTYTLTGVASILMALPLIPIFIMDDAGVVFSTTFWIFVILYECIIWTLGVYLEQMSVGLLYLWHKMWEKNGATGELSSVRKPSLLDDYYDLKKSAK